MALKVLSAIGIFLAGVALVGSIVEKHQDIATFGVAAVWFAQGIVGWCAAKKLQA